MTKSRRWSDYVKQARKLPGKCAPSKNVGEGEIGAGDPVAAVQPALQPIEPATDLLGHLRAPAWSSLAAAKTAQFLASRLPGPGPVAMIKSMAPISPRFFKRWIICWATSAGVAALHGA